MKNKSRFQITFDVYPHVFRRLPENGGEKAKSIAKKAQELGMKEIYICENVDESVKILDQIIHPKDAIVLKASNAMKLGTILEKLKTLSKRKEAKI